MKRNYIFGLLLVALMPFMAMLQSCDDKEEIVFESELPRFEIRADRILFEVIMPTNTPVGDEIYIVGAINGNDAETVVGNPMWQLEKASDYDYKYGIYLDPSTFADGTSLTDGFYFYSVTQGEERALKGDSIMHYDNPSLGTRTNITVTRWASYFAEEGPEVEHDGYVIYVIDNSGYDALALYAWGDVEAFGAWPGILPTGTETIDGVTFKYFDTGEANEGMNINLIFNNNNGGEQLADYNVTLDKDYYLELTPDGVVEYVPEIEHDGYAIFVEDLTGWSTLNLYVWGDGVNDLFGVWPGMVPTGETTINGVTYKYFDTGAANAGVFVNMIMNDGSSQFDLAGITLDRDYYYTISATGGEEVDPNTYTGGGAGAVDPEPDPEPTPTETYTIYVEDLTGWPTVYLYSWGDINDLFGGWPGMLPTGTTEIDGVTYTYWEVEGAGEGQSLIFNDGGDPAVQLADFGITLNRDYYLTITPDGVTERE